MRTHEPRASALRGAHGGERDGGGRCALRVDRPRVLAGGGGVSVRYQTIVADPPWPLPSITMRSGGRRRRTTHVPYPLMTIDAIAALPIEQLADDDAHLWLWATRRVFREGWAAAVARAWGFEPVGEVIWGLRNGGLGKFLGNDHEPVLIARRGNACFTTSERIGGVHFWRQTYASGPRAGYRVHSAKPEAFVDFVESVCAGPYLELFARRHRMGWDVWGNESANTADMQGKRREIAG